MKRILLPLDITSEFTVLWLNSRKDLNMRKTILTAALTLLLPAAAFAEGFENVSVRSDMYVGKVMISGAYQSDVESRWMQHT